MWSSLSTTIIILIIIISLILVDADVSEGVYDYVDPDVLQQQQKWDPTMNKIRDCIESAELRYLASWMNEWMIVEDKLIHSNDEGEYMQNMFHLNLDHIVTQKRRLLHELRKRMLNKGAFVETLKKTL